jgi:hypothetical protein
MGIAVGSIEVPGRPVTRDDEDDNNNSNNNYNNAV